MAQIDVYVDPDATGSGTGDDWNNAYNSLNAAEAARHGDYVTDTDNIVYHLRSSGGTKDTTAVIFNGSTTNSVYDIRIIQEDDNYILQAANTNVLTLSDAFITITKLQVELTATNANYQKALYVDGLPSGSVTNLDKLTLKGANNNSYRERCFSCDNGRTVNIYNSVIYNTNAVDGSIANSLIHNGGSTLNIYNCTISTGRNGAYLPLGTTKAVNCIFANIISVLGSGSWTNSDYNASDLGITTGGSNDIINATFEFVDSANGDFHLTSGDSSGAKDGGTDDPASGLYDDDKDGNLRVSPWDMGAYEYILVTYIGESPIIIDNKNNIKLIGNNASDFDPETNGMNGLNYSRGVDKKIGNSFNTISSQIKKIRIT